VENSFDFFNVFYNFDKEIHYRNMGIGIEDNRLLIDTNHHFDIVNYSSLKNYQSLNNHQLFFGLELKGGQMKNLF
jgi:hypothetical protein